MRMGTVALSKDASRQPLRNSVLALGLCLALADCANYQPKPVHAVRFLHRAQTQSEGGLTVTVAVPSAEESASLFGVPVASNGIQPVWLRVENRTDRDYIFLSADLDPDYFSPQEAVWMHRYTFNGEANWAMMKHFHDLRMRL